MNWPDIADLESIASPGLLVDADRVADNIRHMIQVVDGRTSRLRPHVKTHKMPDVIRMQIDAGITKFKVATIAEARMVAGAAGKDVLLAYQPVGPNVRRLAELIQQFPGTSFAAITDDVGVAQSLAQDLGDPGHPLRLFIDVDCGMHRTGVEWGPAMDRLRDRIESLAGAVYAGLHVYDGHLHAPSIDDRRSAADEIIAKIRRYDQAHPSPSIVAGGSPTFALWAKDTNWDCSPGTTVFWDTGYGSSYPDLEFSIAVALLTRVISKPGGNRICLDVGYKAVAAEMPLDRRLVIPELDDAVFVGQSEEHLVVETSRAEGIALGQPFLALPRHICPTVALHAFATVIRGGTLSDDVWEVTARDR